MSSDRVLTRRCRKANNVVVKRPKSREFVRPIGHLKRHFVPTSSAISHVHEPTYFENFSRDEQSHYRTEFRPKPLGSPIIRATSPNRRNKPHPAQVYHLRRLRSGLVCDVRTKGEGTDKELIETERFDSWTKSRYPAYGPEQIRAGFLVKRGSNQLPAIGIVPGTFVVVSKEIPDAGNRAGAIDDEHWLPGSLKLTTPLTVRGKYEYFPRKRKLIIKRKDAAGIKCPAEFGHRYHEKPRKRGPRPAQMTIRAGG